LIKPWVVIWVGGQPIGIIGVTTEDTPVLSNPGPGVRFTNYIEAVRLGVASLRRDGVNKIIALTHVGVQADRELARWVDGLSVIIGGHSHTPMGPMVNPPVPDRPYPEVIASPSGKPVIVAHDWEWGRWLGDLTIGFDANGDVTRVVAGQPTEVRPSIDPDGGFENRITTFKGPLDQLRAAPVGETRVALNGARADVRSKETNLGNLIADSMLAKTAPAGAQLAIMNGGGIRTSIPAGRVTLGQVLEVMPFGNTLVLLTLTGAQVKEALENGVSQVEQSAGRFPQVGGMRYSWNPSAPAGSRITGIQVSDGRGGFTPIDPNASYRVVVNNFIAGGGDGYSVLQRGANKVDTGFLDADVLVEYLQARSPVNPQVEGRIVQSGALPGVAGVAAPAPAETPAALPRTGGESLPAWLLALAAAGAIGGGLRLRERAARIAAASERETVEVE
jgi:5'-nucleotidase/UDP-sugar diphosphatase